MWNRILGIPEPSSSHNRRKRSTTWRTSEPTAGTPRPRRSKRNRDGDTGLPSIASEQSPSTARQPSTKSEVEALDPEYRRERIISSNLGQDLVSNIPNQFPDQTPLNYALPYRPPVRPNSGFGEASEYYNTSISMASELHLKPVAAVYAPVIGMGAGSAMSYYAGNNNEETKTSTAYNGTTVSPFETPPPSQQGHGNIGGSLNVFAGIAGGAQGSTFPCQSEHQVQHQPQSIDAKPLPHEPVQDSTLPSSGNHARSSFLHSGAVRKFIDWWHDYEDVRKMEEYTEYIGICRDCFDSQTPVDDTPRKHGKKRNSCTHSSRVAENRGSSSNTRRNELGRTSRDFNMGNLIFNAVRAHDSAGRVPDSGDSSTPSKSSKQFRGLEKGSPSSRDRHRSSSSMKTWLNSDRASEEAKGRLRRGEGPVSGSARGKRAFSPRLIALDRPEHGKASSKIEHGNSETEQASLSSTLDITPSRVERRKTAFMQNEKRANAHGSASDAFFGLGTAAVLAAVANGNHRGLLAAREQPRKALTSRTASSGKQKQRNSDRFEHVEDEDWESATSTARDSSSLDSDLAFGDMIDSESSTETSAHRLRADRRPSFKHTKGLSKRSTPSSRSKPDHAPPNILTGLVSRADQTTESNQAPTTLAKSSKKALQLVHPVSTSESNDFDAVVVSRTRALVSQPQPLDNVSMSSSISSPSGDETEHVSRRVLRSQGHADSYRQKREVEPNRIQKTSSHDSSPRNNFQGSQNNAIATGFAEPEWSQPASSSASPVEQVASIPHELRERAGCSFSTATSAVPTIHATVDRLPIDEREAASQRTGEPIYDDELFDPDLFKRSRSLTDNHQFETASQVLADLRDRYSEAPTSMASFFAPPGLFRSGVTADVLPPTLSDEEPIDGSNMNDDVSHEIGLPYRRIPRLTIIAPTPPESVLNSRSGPQASSSSPFSKISSLQLDNDGPSVVVIVNEEVTPVLACSSPPEFVERTTSDTVLHDEHFNHLITSTGLFGDRARVQRSVHLDEPFTAEEAFAAVTKPHKEVFLMVVEPPDAHGDPLNLGASKLDASQLADNESEASDEVLTRPFHGYVEGEVSELEQRRLRASPEPSLQNKDSEMHSEDGEENTESPGNTHQAPSNPFVIPLTDGELAYSPPFANKISSDLQSSTQLDDHTNTAVSALQPSLDSATREAPPAMLQNDLEREVKTSVPLEEASQIESASVTDVGSRQDPMDVIDWSEEDKKSRKKPKKSKLSATSHAGLVSRLSEPLDDWETSGRKKGRKSKKGKSETEYHHEPSERELGEGNQKDANNTLDVDPYTTKTQPLEDPEWQIPISNNKKAKRKSKREKASSARWVDDAPADSDFAEAAITDVRVEPERGTTKNNDYLQQPDPVMPLNNLMMTDGHETLEGSPATEGPDHISRHEGASSLLPGALAFLEQDRILEDYSVDDQPRRREILAAPVGSADFDDEPLPVAAVIFPDEQLLEHPSQIGDTFASTDTIEHGHQQIFDDSVEALTATNSGLAEQQPQHVPPSETPFLGETKEADTMFNFIAAALPAFKTSKVDDTDSEHGARDCSSTRNVPLTSEPLQHSREDETPIYEYHVEDASPETTFIAAALPLFRGSTEGSVFSGSDDVRETSTVRATQEAGGEYATPHVTLPASPSSKSPTTEAAEADISSSFAAAASPSIERFIERASDGPCESIAVQAIEGHHDSPRRTERSTSPLHELPSPEVSSWGALDHDDERSQEVTISRCLPEQSVYELGHILTEVVPRSSSSTEISNASTELDAPKTESDFVAARLPNFSSSTIELHPGISELAPIGLAQNTHRQLLLRSSTDAHSRYGSLVSTQAYLPVSFENADTLSTPLSPSFASPVMRNHTSGLQRSLSSTAVPLRFRRPPQSPIATKDSSVFSSPSPTIAAFRTRHNRLGSSEFRTSTEFRPLYLLESNRKISEPEGSLPSLPSSRTTSRASSSHPNEDIFQSANQSPQIESAQMFTPYEYPFDLTLDTRLAYNEEHYLNSEQTTPKAATFSPAASRSSEDEQFTMVENAASADQLSYTAEQWHSRENTDPKDESVSETTFQKETSVYGKNYDEGEQSDGHPRDDATSGEDDDVNAISILEAPAQHRVISPVGFVDDSPVTHQVGQVNKDLEQDNVGTLKDDPQSELQESEDLNTVSTQHQSEVAYHDQMVYIASSKIADLQHLGSGQHPIRTPPDNYVDKKDLPRTDSLLGAVSQKPHEEKRDDGQEKDEHSEHTAVLHEEQSTSQANNGRPDPFDHGFGDETSTPDSSQGFAHQEEAATNNVRSRTETPDELMLAPLKHEPNNVEPTDAETTSPRYDRQDEPSQSTTYHETYGAENTRGSDAEGVDAHAMYPPETHMKANPVDDVDVLLFLAASTPLPELDAHELDIDEQTSSLDAHRLVPKASVDETVSLAKATASPFTEEHPSSSLAVVTQPTTGEACSTSSDMVVLQDSETFAAAEVSASENETRLESTPSHEQLTPRDYSEGTQAEAESHLRAPSPAAPHVVAAEPSWDPNPTSSKSKKSKKNKKKTDRERNTNPPSTTTVEEHSAPTTPMSERRLPPTPTNSQPEAAEIAVPKDSDVNGDEDDWYTTPKVTGKKRKGKNRVLTAFDNESTEEPSAVPFSTPSPGEHNASTLAQFGQAASAHRTVLQDSTPLVPEDEWSTSSKNKKGKKGKGRQQRVHNDFVSYEDDTPLQGESKVESENATVSEDSVSKQRGIDMAQEVEPTAEPVNTSQSRSEMAKSEIEQEQVQHQQPDLLSFNERGQESTTGSPTALTTANSSFGPSLTGHDQIGGGDSTTSLQIEINQDGNQEKELTPAKISSPLRLGSPDRPDDIQQVSVTDTEPSTAPALLAASPPSMPIPARLASYDSVTLEDPLLNRSKKKSGKKGKKSKKVSVFSADKLIEKRVLASETNEEATKEPVDQTFSDDLQPEEQIFPPTPEAVQTEHHPVELDDKLNSHAPGLEQIALPDNIIENVAQEKPKDLQTIQAVDEHPRSAEVRKVSTSGSNASMLSKAFNRLVTAPLAKVGLIHNSTADNAHDEKAEERSRIENEEKQSRLETLKGTLTTVNTREPALADTHAMHEEMPTISSVQSTERSDVSTMRDDKLVVEVEKPSSISPRDVSTEDHVHNVDHSIQNSTPTKEMRTTTLEKIDDAASLAKHSSNGSGAGSRHYSSDALKKGPETNIAATYDDARTETSVLESSLQPRSASSSPTKAAEHPLSPHKLEASRPEPSLPLHLPQREESYGEMPEPVEDSAPLPFGHGDHNSLAQFSEVKTEQSPAQAESAIAPISSSSDAEFAAAVATGLEDAGFDADVVISKLASHSPSASNSVGSQDGALEMGNTPLASVPESSGLQPHSLNTHELEFDDILEAGLGSAGFGSGLIGQAFHSDAERGLLQENHTREEHTPPSKTVMKEQSSYDTPDFSTRSSSSEGPIAAWRASGSPKPLSSYPPQEHDPAREPLMPGSFPTPSDVDASSEEIDVQAEDKQETAVGSSEQTHKVLTHEDEDDFAQSLTRAAAFMDKHANANADVLSSPPPPTAKVTLKRSKAKKGKKQQPDQLDIASSTANGVPSASLEANDHDKVIVEATPEAVALEANSNDLNAFVQIQQDHASQSAANSPKVEQHENSDSNHVAMPGFEDNSPAVKEQTRETAAEVPLRQSPKYEGNTSSVLDTVLQNQHPSPLPSVPEHPEHDSNNVSAMITAHEGLSGVNPSMQQLEKARSLVAGSLGPFIGEKPRSMSATVLPSRGVGALSPPPVLRGVRRVASGNVVVVRKTPSPALSIGKREMINGLSELPQVEGLWRNGSPASSVVSNRSGGLRRTERSASGDLRAASKRDAEEVPATASNSSSRRQPQRDQPPLQDMPDDGVPDMWRSSPRAQSIPPPLRKWDSMQILDLEHRLEELTAENHSLHDTLTRTDPERLIQDLEARDMTLREKDVEIQTIRTSVQMLKQDLFNVTERNEDLTAANRNLAADTNERYGVLQAEHEQTRKEWQHSSRELESLRQRHDHLSARMDSVVRDEVSTALAHKDAEIKALRADLAEAREQVSVLQQQILASKQDESFLQVRDEDYFDSACHRLCQHVQQWVLRFSKFSDTRACRLSSELRDDQILKRLDNTILDGSDVDHYLSDRIRRRDVFMSVVMTMIWEFIFTRYLFGMDREQRSKLKSLEKTLVEVGPSKAVARWRAVTLTLLSKRKVFVEQKTQDAAAIVHEIYRTMTVLLPPPDDLADQIQTSLRNVVTLAVDLSIEMRTQRAEYIMLPPLQPEYDENGNLTRKVYFNASLMNERSGENTSNEEYERRAAAVSLVLFPLVVKKGDDQGETEEEVVVCPAQVLVAKAGKDRKLVRVMSAAMSIDISTGNGSTSSFAQSDVDRSNVSMKEEA